MRRLAVFVVLLVSSVALSFGQSITGTLLGTVTDPSGSVVSGAKVVITNQGTNQTFETVSNGTGVYDVTNLQPGVYRIHVEAPGYRAFDVNDVTLLVNRTVRTNIPLVLGTFKQTVVVKALNQVVQSETSSVSTVIDTNSIEKLPVNGRTIDTFILTAPGNTGEDSGSNPAIAGSEHWGGTSFTVNGVSYNDPGNGGGAYGYDTSLSTQPSLDTIQEIKVESNNAPAQYASSVAVSIITKSGTNNFHGSLYEFNRNGALAANDYFANASGIAKPPYNRNEFGGSIGGPVFRDRTFFFGSYEGLTLRQSRNGIFSVPTQDERNGLFPTEIKDPLTGIDFPNNQIPANLLDPRTQAVLKFVPLPNIPNKTTFNLAQSLPTKIDVNRYTGRIDQIFDPRDHLTLLVNYSKGDPYEINMYSPTPYNNYSNAGYTTRSASATYLRILTPTMTNEFRASYFEHNSIRQGQNFSFDPSTIIPGLYPHAVGGLPTFSIGGLTAIADRGGSKGNPEITEQLGDTFSWVKGSHQVKAGFDMEYNRLSTNSSVAPSTLGFFYFGFGRYSGNPLANALLGYPNDAVRSTMTPHTDIGQTRYGFYVQDSWEVAPKLTLNYGIRYELQTQPTEHFGTWTNFDFATGQNVVRTVDGKLPVTAIPAMLDEYPYAKSEDVGWGSNVLLADHKDFAPRFGFAFRPLNDNSVVISGGYGIFYNMPPIYQGIYQLGISNPPFRLQQEYDSGFPIPTVTLADPFSTTPKVTANPTLYAVDRQIRNTYSQQWNLTLEQLLPGDIGLRLSYIGNKVVHAPYVMYDMNLPAVQQPTPTLQLIRPYQPWADIYTMRFIGSAFTNQLQLEGTKRYSNGVFFQSSLNWTKDVDDVPQTGSPQNPYNPGGDKGNADGVRRVTFFASAGYDLPFGPGKRFLPGGGVSGKFVGGWSLSSIVQLMTGAPLTVTFDSPLPGWYATRANVVPGQGYYAANKSIKGWLNPNAFVIPQPYTFGNSQRNSVFGPGQKSIDLSLSKTTPIAGRVRLVFRADAFNLTNTANFSNPSADLSVPSTFGVITTTNVAVPARTIQFGLKTLF